MLTGRTRLNEWFSGSIKMSLVSAIPQKRIQGFCEGRILILKARHLKFGTVEGLETGGLGRFGMSGPKSLVRRSTLNHSLPLIAGLLGLGCQVMAAKFDPP